jgi:ABC-type microcin C transport system duplicated ATPase subunit YejF
VTPLSQDCLTPRRLLRSSVTRESPLRASSVVQSISGKSRLGRRSIHLREPTPEQTHEGLQHLTDITNQTRRQLRVVMEQMDVVDQDGDQTN